MHAAHNKHLIANQCMVNSNRVHVLLVPNGLFEWDQCVLGAICFPRYGQKEGLNGEVNKRLECGGESPISP